MELILAATQTCTPTASAAAPPLPLRQIDKWGSDAEVCTAWSLHVPTPRVMQLDQKI